MGAVVTGWGALLLVAFLGLGLGKLPAKRAYRGAIALVVVVIAAVSLGVL